MTLPEIVGFIAFIITTLAIVPQVIKTIKTKETKALSLSMIIMLIVGLSIWAVYGFLINSMPIVIANVIGALGNVGMLITKLKHG